MKNAQLDIFGEPDSGLRATVLAVHRKLCETYHCPVPYFHGLDPLSELVSSLLSHRTTNRVSGRAFRNLRDRFGGDEKGWVALIEAPLAEVESLIRDVTWPDQKARSLQRVLAEIRSRQGGSLALDWMAREPVERSRAWMESIPGVGPKTSAAVLSFSSLHLKALPVDSHHHRVASRLGWVPMKASLVSAHRTLEALLPEEWDAQQVYDHHEVMMFHGQKCCYFQSPECGRCPVLSACPHGQARLARDERKIA